VPDQRPGRASVTSLGKPPRRLARTALRENLITGEVVFQNTAGGSQIKERNNNRILAGLAEQFLDHRTPELIEHTATPLHEQDDRIDAGGVADLAHRMVRSPQIDQLFLAQSVITHAVELKFFQPVRRSI
jgi:hypothetical protein